MSPAPSPGFTLDALPATARAASSGTTSRWVARLATACVGDTPLDRLVVCLAPDLEPTLRAFLLDGGPALARALPADALARLDAALAAGVAALNRQGSPLDIDLELLATVQAQVARLRSNDTGSGC